jgi:signal transduction histidine kinase
VVAILDEAVSEAGPLLAERVTRDDPRGLDTTGQWDPFRLKRVFANLLSNALKYSPSDAPIRLTVDGDEATVRVSLEDQGIGIAPADLDRLFERHARSHEATASGVEGFGLGLFLSRGIVEAHGGRIWAESAGSGRGTTMHVMLPRLAPPLPLS